MNFAFVGIVNRLVSVFSLLAIQNSNSHTVPLLLLIDQHSIAAGSQEHSLRTGGRARVAPQVITQHTTH